MSSDRTVNEVLASLREEREGYKAFVEAVDADLAAQRQARLAERQNSIGSKVAEAFAKGASIADLKRAYGTRDYRTIRVLLDSRQSEVQMWQEKQRIVIPEGTTRYDKETNILYVRAEDGGTVSFDVIPLDDEGYLLSWEGGQGREGALLDGEVIVEAETDALRQQIYKEVSS